MEAYAMTKQIVTSSESGASGSANSEPGIESFERLLNVFQSQLGEFRTEDTILIGNCPKDVTNEEINKFFCGFASIVKLKKLVFKSLTTNVFIAKFDSAESASRSKVLNTLALNGKKILLLQPDEKHCFNKKNVVELNGLQEHSEEVIYDHMSTFGNVSFVLKTSTVTYIVYEEASAAESSCRCDYLDQYPVTIRSVLDYPPAGAGGQGSSIETCILEQIDQNSSLLADEEEGQINNFMQLLDMENLEEYLEQDEKEKSSASDKPLLEVGNEEIIVTEDENVENEGDKEADVAAIEKQALQHQHHRKKTAATVLVDDQTRRLLNLSGSFLRLNDLPHLVVGVRRVPNKVKIKPKKDSLPTKYKESKKKKSVVTESSASKDNSRAFSDNLKKPVEQENIKAKKPESSVEKKKSVVDKEVSKSKDKSEKEKSKKKHTKKHNSEKVTEQKQMKPAESIINENETKTEAYETISSYKTNICEHKVIVNIAEHKHIQDNIQNKGTAAQGGEKDPSSETEKHRNISDEIITLKEEFEATINKKPEFLQNKTSVFVQLTRLTSKQIHELSKIRTKAATSPITEDEVDPTSMNEHIDKIRKRKPGPAKGAVKEKQDSLEKQGVTENSKKAEKRSFLDSDLKSSACLDAKNDSKLTSSEVDFTQKKKKLNNDKFPEKLQMVQPESSMDGCKTKYTEGLEAQNASEQTSIEVQQPKIEETNTELQQTCDKPTVLPEFKSEFAQLEQQEVDSQSALDVLNTAKMCKTEFIADLESDEERPLVMDISFDTTEEIIGMQSQEVGNIERKVVLLDSKSAGLLKGRTHDGNLLFLDGLPRVAVKVKKVTTAQYNITKSKEHHKSSTGHNEKPTSKKVTFDSSAVKKKEDKPEKPRKTNLDKIDSKFLPAGSKLKSKIKSKTEINHKKHLPVPELPIELKTHLNTSFKIPKKNSSVKPQSIDRNASELNCLHKEQDERDKQRKRFQKERRPRDGPGGRDWKQNRLELSKEHQAREPSPIQDFFDPSFDDHSPSPQRLPPTPSPAKEIQLERDGNQRASTKNRPGNKPSFQEIWNIPEQKSEVWAKPPWGPSTAAIGSGDTWDSKTVHPQRERNANARSKVTMDTRKSLSPVARAPKAINTIDSGESWSPGFGAPQRKIERPPHSRTIDDGESWSPGTKRGQKPNHNIIQDRHTSSQLNVRRSRSPHQVQLGNTISSGDMWDLEVQLTGTRKLIPSHRNANLNPLMTGDVFDEPSEIVSSAKFEQRSSRHSRSPFQQRRNRSKSPGRKRRSNDRSPIRPIDQEPDRRNVLQSQPPVAWQQNLERRVNRPLDRRNYDRDQSPFGSRRRSRSRSPVRLQSNFDKSPLRGSPNRMPFRTGRSCSPRPDLTLSYTDMWDARTSSRTKIPPKESITDNTLLAGVTWDSEILPLRGPADRSPPRLRESMQDHRRRYNLDRLSPNGRRRSNDRLLPEQSHQSFNRTPFCEGGNIRWSRDQSTTRRKRSRSRSPDAWRQGMERSNARRRHSVGDQSPNYQKMLDYWKDVEDREMEANVSSVRQHLGRINELRLSQSPERWMCRGNDRNSLRRKLSEHLDRDILRQNDLELRQQTMGNSQYSPSSAFDVISSDDECDFTNPRRPPNDTPPKSVLPAREPLDTIPLKLPTRSQQPKNKLSELPSEATLPTVEHEASRDSFDSVPMFKESEATPPQSQGSAEDKKSVLENLKQRAEGLKKLEEMKLARQKLFAQIGIRKPNMSSEKLDDDTLKHPDPEPFAFNRQIVSAAATVPVLDNMIISNADSLLNKPLRAPAITGSLLPMPQQDFAACLPQPFNIALALSQSPSQRQPPPPPDEQRPPEPNFVNTMIPPPSASWNLPSSPFAPMTLIDVSKPPPNLANPLLNTMSSPQYESDEEKHFEPRSSLLKDSHTFNSQLTSSNKFDKFQRSQQIRGHTFNISSENNSFGRMPSDENDLNNMEMQDLNEMSEQQRYHDPRPQQQHRFGANRQFMRQQQQQPLQRRDPRQNNDGNVYGGGQFNLNNNNNNNPPNTINNNLRNNFNNNPRNNFNNNNSRNNLNNNNSGNNFNFNNSGNNFNNPRNNFNYSNPGNNFSVNNPGNNLNSNNPGNNFTNNNPGNNFTNNNPGNNFTNNNPGNNFTTNNPGNNFNNNRSGNNFNKNNSENNFNNNNSGNNFNNNNPGNYFNNNRGARGGGRVRFNNNQQQQQRFNFQQQNRIQWFNNNRNNQQQQQQRFLMQQQEMFEEGCFDMNELDCNDDGDANNWDDLM